MIRRLKRYPFKYKSFLLFVIFIICYFIPGYYCEGQAKKEMVTGYINFPKNDAEIENNRRVEKKFINLAPMYGYAKKDSAYQITDKQFIDSALAICKCTKAEASKQCCDLGWTYCKKNDIETACKRFNQAYLLDSTNYILYWGFATIMSTQRRFDESFALFEKANTMCQKKNDSTYAFFCLDYCRNFYNKYYFSKQKQYLDSALQKVDRANLAYPEHAIVFSYYSNLFFQEAQYRKAIDAYNKSVQLDGHYANVAFQKEIGDSLKKHDSDAH